MNQKPSAAPNCWGSKYQDGDPECRQCRYSDTCKMAMLTKLTTPAPINTTSLPVIKQLPSIIPTLPVPPVPQMSSMASRALVPLPAHPYLAPSPVPNQIVKTTTPSPSLTPTTAPTVSYYSSGAYSIPDPLNPNPVAPMQRPGVSAPVHYFTQYPGEDVGTRIGKNIVLRALEAVFYELMSFFRHWTWPPSKK